LLCAPASSSQAGTFPFTIDVELQPPATTVAPGGTFASGCPLGEGGEDVGAVEQPASSNVAQMRTSFRFT
jgi:hypothetical protein